ncbi:MAG TPA: carboxypeptidase regulatory-like domain-containing protein [Thermoplasmata archaeon]|nr:carboxypeptidase regulatory-like domain-containing protein [Thermoplasmata archaeon]
MDERKSWLRENWRIGLVLVLILGLALFLRVYFVYNEFAPAGYWTGGGDYSGGSDPFYWERALLYSFQTGKELSWDAAMNYPIGFPAVRPPLFDWFNLLGGYVISPVFPGGAWDAMVWMLNMNAAIFGVLSIIPTYLIGKEAFNRRAGILAALLLTISAASLQRSHATIAVHDSWTLFFVICTFYFYLRALKTLNRRRWVENWFQGKAVTAGVQAFLRENRSSVLYAFLAGLSIAVTALSWQGWAYVPVILILIFVVEVLLDRIRNQDALGVTILFMIILATPLLVSFPWYSVRNQIHVWWDVPFYLFLVASALGLIFTVTRDYPWTIVIPATFVAGGAGLLIGFTVNPSLLVAFYSGAGYFVKNKVYQTIAEAQEPGMSELILNYGLLTFGIGLLAVGYMVYQIPKRNNPAYTMLVLWTAGALFMALAAARFLFNAGPVMAIATGYALDLVLTRFGFEEMRRTYRSLAEGSWRNAVRKSVKPRHVIVAVLIAGLVLLPNVWFAVDSGIPYEQKGIYDKQIQSLLPSFLRAPGYGSAGSGNTFYLGAFGYSLPNQTQYFPAAYQWLSTQDANVPLLDRPAVLAWWDYGFEITERGGHPVVADPFQNGYAISGQVILSQNESSTIGLMALRIIEGDYRAHGLSLSPAVSQILTGYGIDPNLVTYTFRNPGFPIPIILHSPNVYGPWDSNLQTGNAPYIYLGQILLGRLSEDQLVNLYQAVSAATGTSIGYFMVDTRLFPISASNTGIFYAPAKLSDHRVLNLVNGQVMPYDFFQLFANTQTANNLPIQFVSPTDQVTSTSIQYQPMFYNSMFYRAYVGYSPSVVGSSDKGIPGMDQALAAYVPEPAWNLTHFRLVYRTAYYNPYPDASNHTGAWRAVNYDQAAKLQQQITAGKVTGVVDMSPLTSIQNGAVILRYYPGAYVNGTVAVGGVPMPGVRITVTDELGTPHFETTTDAAGHYSAIVPFGNVTLTASTGKADNRTLVGPNVLGTVTIPVSLDQANRVNEDLDGDGVPDWLMTHDFDVTPMSLQGTVYFDLNHNAVYDAGDLAAAGATVTLAAADFQRIATVTTGPTGAYALTDLPAGTYRVTVAYGGRTFTPANLTITATTPSKQDIGLAFSTVHGSTVDANGVAMGGVNVTLTDASNRTTWQTTSNATGVYDFPFVLPGNFSLTAVSGELSSVPLGFDVGALGFTQNLTLTPSGQVQGTTELFGVALPYATVRFQESATDYVIATVTSDANGHFSLALPAGTWNVNGRMYQGSSLFATVGQFAITQGATTVFNPNFVDGARVTGSVTAIGQSGDLRAHIGFLGATGEWWLRSALGNTYLAYLPTGSYAVVANTPSDAWVGTASVGGPATSLSLNLWNGTPLSGTVYWDMNGNGKVDTGEGISGARIDLVDNTGQRTVAVSGPGGAFSLTLFDNRTYSGTITAAGFSPHSIPSATPSEIGSGVTYALTPTPVSLTGTVFLNGTPILNRALGLHAVARSEGALSVNGTTFTDGTFSLSLAPGSYDLVVDENVSSASSAWRYQNLASDHVVLFVDEGSASYNLAIVARALVKGNVTVGGVAGPATVNFRGLDDRTLETTASGYSVYLRAGTYSVVANRTIGSAPYEVLANVTVPSAGNVTLALSAATMVAGQIMFNGTAVSSRLSFTFVRKEGGTFPASSLAGGSFSAVLVVGNYSVQLNDVGSTTVGNVTQYYRYAFAGSLTIAPGTTSLTYNLPASRTYDNTTVTGLVSLGGGGVDASLSFIARSGGALNAQAASASNGTYSVSLAPGTYVVYATRAAGPSGFLATLTVPHATTFSYPVSLLPAFVLSGVTTDPSGARVAATVNVTGTAQLGLRTDAAGNYQTLLPVGSYTVTADRTQTEQGVVVDYEGTATFSLQTDTVVNLQLGRLDHRAAVLTWDASQNRTVNPGGAVTYTIRVQNTGNVQDTFALTGSASAGWFFTFFPTTVALNYGTAANETAVTVTIQTPAGALVNHGAVTITATSTADSHAKGSVAVTGGIVRTRGLTLQVDPASGTFDGQYLNYTVNVHNTGNAPEAVDLSIQNPTDVAAAGWTPGLTRSGAARAAGLVLTNVSVDANASTTVKLVLRLNGANGGTTVALAASAEGAPSVAAQTTYTATLPALSLPSGVGVSGPGTVLQLPLNSLLLAAVVGGVAAAALALFLTRRRR